MNRKKLKKDKALLKSIKKDKSNFDKIYKQYHDHVLNFLKKRVNQKSVCEDLASEVFEKAFKSIDDFKWQGVTISSWIFRIARNLLTDYYRKVGRRGTMISLGDVEEFLEDEKVGSVDRVIEDEEERALFDALREFKEKDQYLVYYKFFEDLSNKEIAQITGLKESNVGTRLYRIRKKLRKYLKKT